MEISDLQFWKKVVGMRSSTLSLNKSIFNVIKQLRVFYAINKE